MLQYNLINYNFMVSMSYVHVRTYCRIVVIVHQVTDADICDILVSCDGTWPNSGFSSLFGALFVIAYKTGNESDYTVLSKHCPQ